jgi:hypothetical protein
MLTAMDVESQGPFRVGLLRYHPSPHTAALTVVCKATFRLQPGEVALAEPDAINEDDTHWDDDPSRSLSAPTDLYPFKPRADVLLVGSAYAPRGERVRSFVAQLLVGEVDKSIEVFADRALGPNDQLREGPRIERMRLRYERAAGGPGTSNPVGIAMDGAPDATGYFTLPNVQPPGLHITSRRDAVPPIGFGPIAPSWPTRAEKLGRRAGTWPDAGWTARPMPEGIDSSFFNVAPRDQQVSRLSEDQRIVLVNLHPEHPRLVTSLPGLTPHVVVERAGTRPEEPSLTADTLWIDTDRGICTLTFRGQVFLRSYTEKVVVRVSAAAALRTLDEEPELDPSHTMLPMIRTEPVTPFTPASPGASPMAHPGREDPTPKRDAPQQQDGSESQTLFLMDIPVAGAPPAASSAAMPFSPGSPAALRPGVATPVPSHARSPGKPAVAGGRPPEAPPLMAPMPAVSSWNNESRDVAPKLTVGQQAAMAVQESPRAEVRESAPASPPAAPPARREAEALQLLWFDTDSVPRIRRRPAWRKILEALQQRPLDEDLDEPDIAKDPMDIEDRREVFEVLARGDALEPDGIQNVLQGAVRDGGKFVPPLALLAGELSFSFDEIETLAAVVTGVAPFSAGDEAVKSAVDAARDFLATPGIRSTPAVAEALTTRIREAFSAAPQKRAVGADYLDAQAKRALLSQRHYLRRVVFGAAHIRAGLTVLGSPHAVPTYLRDSLSGELPMFHRFPVRVIGELHMAVDQYETHSSALRVFALARVMPFRR